MRAVKVALVVVAALCALQVAHAAGTVKDVTGYENWKLGKMMTAYSFKGWQSLGEGGYGKTQRLDFGTGAQNVYTFVSPTGDKLGAVILRWQGAAAQPELFGVLREVLRGKYDKSIVKQDGTHKHKPGARVFQLVDKSGDMVLLTDDGSEVTLGYISAAYAKESERDSAARAAADKSKL